MSFDLHLLENPSSAVLRVVPVRFARADSGGIDPSAPDLDNRGFKTDSNCSARGPVVGVMPGSTIQIRVIRDRLESGALLFASVDDASLVELVHPAAGASLSPSDSGGRSGDTLYLRGAAGVRRSGMTLVKIHFGAAGGPVMAELAVRVHPRLRIPVAVHMVSINGTGPSMSFADIQDAFHRANHFLAPAGVTLDVRSPPLADSVTGFILPGVCLMAFEAAPPRMPTPPGVTEHLRVLGLRPDAAALNAYFVRTLALQTGGPTSFQEPLGQGITQDVLDTLVAAAPSPPSPRPGRGIMVATPTDTYEYSHVLAHEIGHLLDLAHYGGGEQPPADNIKEDIWGHRNLMHNAAQLHPLPGSGHTCRSTEPRRRVGYGDGSVGPRAGGFLGIKSFNRVRQSAQVAVLRSAVLARKYVPF